MRGAAPPWRRGGRRGTRSCTPGQRLQQEVMMAWVDEWKADKAQGLSGWRWDGERGDEEESRCGSEQGARQPRGPSVRPSSRPGRARTQAPTAAGLGRPPAPSSPPQPPRRRAAGGGRSAARAPAAALPTGAPRRRSPRPRGGGSALRSRRPGPRCPRRLRGAKRGGFGRRRVGRSDLVAQRCKASDCGRGASTRRL